MNKLLLPESLEKPNQFISLLLAEVASVFVLLDATSVAKLVFLHCLFIC